MIASVSIFFFFFDIVIFLKKIISENNFKNYKITLVFLPASFKILTYCF